MKIWDGQIIFAEVSDNRKLLLIAEYSDMTKTLVDCTKQYFLFSLLALDDGSYLNDDDDTIDQDLSSLTSFDGLHVIGRCKPKKHKYFLLPIIFGHCIVIF